MNCPICNNEAQHKHHIISKSKGGNNKKSNIVYLCASCHHKVHSGSIVLEGIYFTLDGYKLIWHLKGEESITSYEPEVYLF